MLVQIEPKGDLKLDGFVVDKFIEYVKEVIQTPYLFAVSKDGWGYNYYYCSAGAQCQGGAEQILAECQRYSNDVECFYLLEKELLNGKMELILEKAKYQK